MPLEHEQPLQMEREEHDHNLFAKRVVDVVGNSLVPSSYDYIEVAYPNSTTEVYTFKNGGSGGTTVSTVTVVYTSATKADLLSVTKS